MRKNAKYILATLLLLCVTTSVNAEECDYAKQVELNNEASTVKAIYEETEIDTGMTTYYIDEETEEVDESKIIPLTEKGFTVKILNITENIYVHVSNDYDNTEKDYYYKDTDNGVLVLNSFASDNVYNYKITVRGNSDGCSGKELRNITLMVPKYNEFSQLSACDEYPDFQYCQKFTSSMEEITISEFQKKLDEYKKNNKSQTAIEREIKEKNDEEKNKKMIIIAVVCLIVVGVATSVIIIRKRSRLI